MSKAGHGGRRKHAAGHDEEHENHERWLVSYADMLTLLFVLFVVMFAISQVDQNKFNQLRRGLADGFGAPSVAFSNTGDKIQQQAESTAAIDLASGAAGGPKAKTEVQAQDQALEKAVRDADRARQQRMLEAAEKEVQNFEEIQRKLLEAMRREGMADAIRFNIDERGLVVTIVTSDVIFAGDRADLLPAGQRVVEAIGPPLLVLPNRIAVEGHTNQLPVPTVNFPSAWELSSARASVVVRHLINRSGLPAARMSAVGYAGERPLYPADDPRATTLNRRVEIIILSTLPPAERALLPTVAGHQPS